MDQAIFCYFLNLYSFHFYMLFPPVSVIPFSSAHDLVFIGDSIVSGCESLILVYKILSNSLFMAII